MEKSRRKPADPRWKLRHLNRRILDCPEPGYFRLRLVKRGPWVPALIWLPCPLVIPIPGESTPGPEDWCTAQERPRLLRAKIGDDDAEPLLVWERGQTIGLAEYRYRMARREWAFAYDRSDPDANPRRPIDLAKRPPVF